MIVSIDNVLFASVWGDVIFSALDEDARRYRCIAKRGSMFRLPAQGDAWDVDGNWRDYREMPQLCVTRATLVRPSGQLLIRYLSGHAAFRGTGVGEATARRLHEQFGSQLPALIATGDLSLLADEIGDARAAALREAWLSLFDEHELVEWMIQRGLDLRWSEKLRKVYGGKARAEVEHNPYVLLPVASWPEVDRLALHQFGVDPLDQRRTTAAVEASVYEAMDETGSTLFSAAGISQRARAKLPASADCAEAVRGAVSMGAIIQSKNGLQAFGVSLMEREVESWLQSLRACSDTRNLFGQATVLGRILALAEKEAGIHLNAEQKRAVELGLTEPLALVLGGAGVGKTTLLRALSHCLRQSGQAGFLLAVAGRAARRMREALGQELGTHFPCTTIASFLMKRTSRLSSESSPLIIIDEASMVDLSQFYRLSRMLPPRSRLLLVGDPAQLPPIGAGLVFHRIVQRKDVPIVELTQIYRQAAESGIPAMTLLIREGQVPRFSNALMTESAAFVPARNLVDTCIKVRTQLLAKGSVVVLGVHRKTIQAVNRMLAPPGQYAPGVPVIYGANDANLDLSNGSLGTVTARDAEAVTVEWDDGITRTLRGVHLAYLQLAYAITVHRAQGSQWAQVIVLIEPSRLLDRSLIYTAATRAQLRVVFVGDLGAFAGAVSRKTNASNRCVGFLDSRAVSLSNDVE